MDMRGETTECTVIAKKLALRVIVDAERELPLRPNNPAREVQEYSVVITTVAAALLSGLFTSSVARGDRDGAKLAMVDFIGRLTSLAPELFGVNLRTTVREVPIDRSAESA